MCARASAIWRSGAGRRCQAARGRARRLCRERGQAHVDLAGRRAGASCVQRDAHQRARMLHELNGVMPEDGILVADGGFAAHWAGLIYDTKRAGRGFVPGPRLGLDRLRPAGRHRRGAGGARVGRWSRSRATAGSTCRWAIWRRARRWALSFCHRRLQQCGVRLREGAAAPCVRGGRLRPPILAETNYARVAEAMGCTGICVENPSELARRFRERPGGSRASPVVHRRRRHARSGQDAARRRQPHGRGQEGRSGGVVCSANTWITRCVCSRSNQRWRRNCTVSLCQGRTLATRSGRG